MSGLSIMECHTDLNGAGDGDQDTWALTETQAMGDACAVCHARWPRPRLILGLLADGSAIYGCAECAAVAERHTGAPTAAKASASMPTPVLAST